MPSTIPNWSHTVDCLNATFFERSPNVNRSHFLSIEEFQLLLNELLPNLKNWKSLPHIKLSEQIKRKHYQDKLLFPLKYTPAEINQIIQDAIETLKLNDLKLLNQEQRYIFVAILEELGNNKQWKRATGYEAKKMFEQAIGEVFFLYGWRVSLPEFEPFLHILYYYLLKMGNFSQNELHELQKETSFDEFRTTIFYYARDKMDELVKNFDKNLFPHPTQMKTLCG